MASLTKCLVALAFLASSTIASAGGGGPHHPVGGPPAAEGACKNDIEKLCKDVQPGEGRILQCLKSHQADVSPACKNAVGQVKAQLKTAAAACDADVEKFCWDTPPGKGGIAKCLKQHSAEVSPDCRTAVAHVKKSAKASKAPPAENPSQPQ